MFHDDEEVVEIQLDPKRVILILIGVIGLCFIFFLIGRWTAEPSPAAEPASGEIVTHDQEKKPSPAEEKTVTLFPDKTEIIKEPVEKESIEKEPVKKVVKPEATPPPREVVQEEKEPAIKKVDKPAAEPPRTGDWVIQVVAYRRKSSASDMVDRLKSKGYSVFYDTYRGKQGILYRVRVGPFNTKSEATGVARKLETEEKLASPWITKR